MSKDLELVARVLREERMSASNDMRASAVDDITYAISMVLDPATGATFITRARP